MNVKTLIKIEKFRYFISLHFPEIIGEMTAKKGFSSFFFSKEKEIQICTIDRFMLYCLQLMMILAMKRESRKMEPVQKAPMMEKGTGIFRKCLSELFFRNNSRKTGYARYSLEFLTHQGFCGNVKMKLGGTRIDTVPLCGAVFIFSIDERRLPWPAF